MHRVLVLDLDGTLCLGDAPVRRVAHHAFAVLDSSRRRQAEELLDGYLAGGHRLLPEARDGYDAVARVAAGAGIDRAALGRAFLAARAEHELWLPEVEAPDAVVDVLRAMRGVRRVLVTNFPELGMARIVEHLGLADVLDEVVTSADKPDGMAAILDRLGVPERVDAGRVAGIGDRWVNDLRDIHRRGGTTLHIDAGGWADGSPTHRAARPDDLAAALDTWATGGPRVTFW